MARHDTVPILVATGVGLLMIWLAGAPLEVSSRSAAASLVLLAPGDELERFPQRFEWSPVAGAELYEIYVAPADTSIAPLFRLRGTSCELDLTFDPGKEPPAGGYTWEVRAMRSGRTLTRAEGTFQVGTSGQEDSMR